MLFIVASQPDVLWVWTSVILLVVLYQEDSWN